MIMSSMDPCPKNNYSADMTMYSMSTVNQYLGRYTLNWMRVSVQCAPHNVPIALKVAVKAQLDKYEADGHMTSVTEPTDWISNMVIVKKPEKLRVCIDPKHRNQALKHSYYIIADTGGCPLQTSQGQDFHLGG